MASTSRQSSLFGIQDWKQIYQAYSQADLQSYDFESLRKNFIDYLTQNYPETFNDYVESSEFVALLDVMAYMGQALAFRSDLNARENFLDTAQRRDSVIKLANLVSYNPKRNIAGQGLVKVTAVSTTENLTDINGVNLSNSTILWNDPANSSWQEQFNTIINSALINSQRVGKPGNTQTLLDVKTDEYTINIPLGQLPVIPYQAEIDGTVMNFELVSVTSLNENYLYEIPPAPASQFNMLYRNDKLGYGSPNTGFFFYFKQGSLQSVNFNFLEKIQNNLQPINVQGINNEDTWLYKTNTIGITTELWTQVQNVYVAATNSQGQSVKPIYSVTSRSNDEVTYVFSDGVFGEIPVGSFRAYVRSSNALQYTIDPSEMNGIAISVDYVSRNNRTETLTFTIALQTPSNTAQNRETLTAIKERAPARFYTQNRMVNGEDYTNFPFTLYNSIIKSKALNRTSVGVSRNLDLLDPTGKYSSTNVFADDGALTFSNLPYSTTFSTSTTYYAAEFLTTILPGLLSAQGSIQYYQTYYPKYPLVAETLRTKWNLTSVSGSQVTGFFFTQTIGNENPIPVATFSSTSTKYITKGALLKFVPIDPMMYFDTNNRLTTVNTGKQYIWVGVDNIIGDGYNYGVGNLSSGVGPITLNAYVPPDCQLQAVGGIVPVFSNTLSLAVRTEALSRIRLQQDFALKFNNALLLDEERWSVINIPAYSTTPVYSADQVEFIHSATDGSYTVNVNNVTYSFSSVSEVRFVFDGTQRVYDPKTGQVLSDFVNILKQSGVDYDYYMNVIGQPIQSDGFSNDFEVTISPINNVSGFSIDPDFYTEIVGLGGSTNGPKVTPSTSVFFLSAAQTDGLTTLQLLAPNTVIYTDDLPSLATVNDHVYEYATGSVFYCPTALTVSLSASSIVGTSNYLVIAVCNINHKLTTGMTVAITDAGTASDQSAYNGVFVVTVSDSTTFTYITSSSAQLSTVTSATVANRFYESSAIQGIYPTVLELIDVTTNYTVVPGRGGLNFQFRHNSGQANRIDPATTNIIDLFLVTQGYYTNYMNWISDTTGTVPKPAKPTLNQLQQSYGELDSYKMISDSVVLNSVTFKPLFGTKAAINLQATVKVVKNSKTTASDTQIRSSVLGAMNSYFSIDNWNFGDTFFFSELSSYLHVQLGSLISSVVLVPANPAQKFGDMYEIRSAPDEIFVNGATASDIIVISSLTANNMNR